MPIGATSYSLSAGTAASSFYASASTTNVQRPPVVIEAKRNPNSPNEFTANLAEEVTSGIYSPSRPNLDPASRAFLSVASLTPVTHKIDIYV